jgi:hypothetical protein
MNRKAGQVTGFFIHSHGWGKVGINSDHLGSYHPSGYHHDPDRRLGFHHLHGTLQKNLFPLKRVAERIWFRPHNFGPFLQMSWFLGRVSG